MQKTVWENSVSLEIFGSQENRLDVEKRFVLMRSELKKSQARDFGRTANYNFQTSGEIPKQVQK